MAANFFIVAIVIIVLASSIKVVREDERIAVFRLGRLVNIVGPGIFFLLPFIEKCKRIELRKHVPDYKALTEEELFEKIRQII